jgi:hypothetical protein
MKTMLFSLLPALLLWFGNCRVAIAQEENTDTAKSEEVTLADEEVIEKESRTGKFDPVKLEAGASTDLKVEFPLSLADKGVLVQQLDGGQLSIDGESARIDQEGRLSLSFAVDDQPGIYRLVVIDPDGGEDGNATVVGLMQFEVPDPQEEPYPQEEPEP